MNTGSAKGKILAAWVGAALLLGLAGELLLELAGALVLVLVLSSTVYL